MTSHHEQPNFLGDTTFEYESTGPHVETNWEVPTVENNHGGDSSMSGKQKCAALDMRSWTKVKVGPTNPLHEPIWQCPASGQGSNASQQFGQW